MALSVTQKTTQVLIAIVWRKKIALEKSTPLTGLHVSMP
jgi:hypothetical protein